MTDGAVAWGVESYIASDDAASALKSTRRAGSDAAHSDDAGLISLVADRLLELPFSTWGFGDSIAFEALISASDFMKEDSWARFAQGWGRAWATRALPFARLDCTAPGRALVGLAERYSDEKLLERVTELADYLLLRPTLNGVFETWESSPLLAPYGGAQLTLREADLLASPPAGVFVDCLHFDPPFFAELGRVTGEPAYVNAGVQQALGYVRLLQRESGLFDHFALRGQKGSFGPGWGRGQGWAALGLLELLETLEKIPGRPGDEKDQVRASARRLLTAMKELQRTDGHWFAVVDDPASGDEYSTAAFMAIALDKANRLGLVTGEDAMRAQGLARAAVLSSLDARGQLREVSAAVYASTKPSHYAHVPLGFVVPWGQGPALLALISGAHR